MQDVWRYAIGWDYELKDEQYDKWSVWITLLPKVKHISIPRRYLHYIPHVKDTVTELHVFADHRVTLISLYHVWN